MITGKPFSEALILASANPQFDKRLFIEFPRKIQVQNMLCTKMVLFNIQDNICAQLVLTLYFLGNSMNNLSLYCGLTDSKMRASDTDLPVTQNIGVTDSGHLWNFFVRGP